mmetsp:Transcript_27950/g.65023  ORF Transcript_27950/g.65023 Transcript_27950/m.65023 type:complete len:255 (-) Transcript_27950:1515-2279(-)
MWTVVPSWLIGPLRMLLGGASLPGSLAISTSFAALGSAGGVSSKGPSRFSALASIFDGTVPAFASAASGLPGSGLASLASSVQASTGFFPFFEGLSDLEALLAGWAASEEAEVALGAPPFAASAAPPLGLRFGAAGAWPFPTSSSTILLTSVFFGAFGLSTVTALTGDFKAGSDCAFFAPSEVLGSISSSLSSLDPELPGFMLWRRCSMLISTLFPAPPMIRTCCFIGILERAAEFPPLACESAREYDTFGRPK